MSPHLPRACVCGRLLCMHAMSGTQWKRRKAPQNLVYKCLSTSVSPPLFLVFFFFPLLPLSSSSPSFCWSFGRERDSDLRCPCVTFRPICLLHEMLISFCQSSRLSYPPRVYVRLQRDEERETDRVLGRSKVRGCRVHAGRVFFFLFVLLQWMRASQLVNRRCSSRLF